MISLDRWILAPAILAAALAGCAGEGSGDVNPPAPDSEKDFPATDADAVRFLTRATFGPTPSAIEHLSAVGYTQWLDDQLALPASLEAPELASMGCFTEAIGVDSCPDLGDDAPNYHAMREELWWQNALYAEDQLRQRVAFALSEIFVVSYFSDALILHPLLLADYYDTLAKGAFGTYRELLEEVTLHPAMGAYLSMVRNQRPDLEAGIRPDENYAREVMQLFSIGLDLLNIDGTPQLGTDGERIPTYDQSVVVGMAHAFTGWNFAGTDPSNIFTWVFSQPKLGRMQAFEAYHDSNAKQLVTGYEAPAGLSAEEDLELVLDLLAGHPNVGPFLARRLIQRLVTSNPSPEYIGRVATVFNDDGEGVRGNLGAVVRAILMDTDAREGFAASPATFGKVREPLLRFTALLRAFDAEPQNGRVNIPWALWGLNQAPLASPSVFNFFLPDFAPKGPVLDAGLAAPELQITTHTFINRAANLLGWIVYGHTQANPCDDCQAPLLDVSSAAQLAATPDRLIDHLDERLTGGTLSTSARSTLINYVSQLPYDWEDSPTPPGYYRVQEALYLITTCPEFTVQK